MISTPAKSGRQNVLASLLGSSHVGCHSTAVTLFENVTQIRSYFPQFNQKLQLRDNAGSKNTGESLPTLHLLDQLEGADD